MRNRIIRCSQAFGKNLKVPMAFAFAIVCAAGTVFGLAVLGGWIAGQAGIVVGALIGFAIGAASVIAAVETYINGDCDRED